ncbi:Gfo/Idh/MocA family oxidoreductase [Leifsonia shinshuensis]|uniref:Gfo/Idh/MocA family protein n=1 Tax=Leifsonia shinshuensis TaxID=150026 RepID=UPI001F50967E|nr:Gfo/Idh/MocA family oxidoreductase [Leifsonia shinshuensis]MCI0158088.1 Gfo/Idh/MocA family oxidoreductase [Leifsonia shinshuensis]
MSAHRPVGVGLIGAGVISAEYLGNLTRFPGVDVRFVADLDEGRAAARAAAFGIPGSGSVERLLADDDVEIVVNLTLPQVHVEVGLQAIAAGKHVWSEKPLGLDRASARLLLDAAAGAGLRVAAAPDTFLGAGVQTARRLIESGAIGVPQSALTLLQSPGPESWHPNPDFLFQDGAGPLFDVGPYYLTALVQLLGPLASVDAVLGAARRTRTIGSGPRAGETFAVTVPTYVGAGYRFVNGTSAQSIFSFDSHLQRTRFEISGSEGTLVVPDVNGFDGELLLHTDGGEPRSIAAVGSTTTRGTGVAELAEALREGRAERATGELAYHVLDAMVSTIEAGEASSPVVIASRPEVQPALSPEWSALAAEPVAS